MIRRVIAILKKHLDYAEVSYDAMWEALELTPFDVLREFPDYHQLRRLARELIIEITKVDSSKLVEVPSVEESRKFLRSIYPQDIADDFLEYHVEALRVWLAGYRRNYAHSPPKVVIDVVAKISQ